MAFLGVASGFSTTKGFKGIFALFLLFLHIVDLKSYGVEAKQTMNQIEDELELERELKRLNVPHPLKTIITKEGDILDCVDVNNQPSLSHPLLKDHKIQMEPSVYPEWGANITSSAVESLLSTFELEECPEGFVPIRRTSKEDLLRARTLSREFITNFNRSNRHFAGQLIADVNNGWPGLHGASATINVYNPTLTDRMQFTNVQIWINGGPNESPNYIMAGWSVNPSLYRDPETHLFTFWTGDNYKNGCPDTHCRGFVQTHRSIRPGAIIRPTSDLGNKQFEFHLAVHQDRITGHWWLQFQSMNIGYWPKNLFNSLQTGAKGNSWGGIVRIGSNGEYPKMGSGMWPNNLYACYLHKIEFLDEKYNVAHPLSEGSVTIRVDNKHCNDIKYIPYDDVKHVANINVGGPGGRCG